MNIYEGSENYIFVSYAHADSDRVLPILEALDREGFRFWYDKKIKFGSEWPAYLEARVKDCHTMIFFVSKKSVNSKYCRREVNYADKCDKEIVVVYLEDAELVEGLDWLLSTNQSVYRKNFRNDNDFSIEIINAEILSSCKKTDVVVSEESKDIQNSGSISLVKWTVISVVSLVTILGVIIALSIVSIIPLEICQWIVGSILAIVLLAITIVTLITKGKLMPIFIVDSIVAIGCTIYLNVHSCTNEICFSNLAFVLGIASCISSLICVTDFIIKNLSMKN